jgi:Zn-dependent protease/CBS domain-containing protein
VARVFNIPVKINYNWFPVFALHIYAVSVFYLPRHLHHLRPFEYWVLGSVMTLLLFLSVLGHELGHALLARAEGLHTQEILLHIFGGLTRFEREAPTPMADFKIGVAGPASSFLQGLSFFLLNQASIYLFASRPAALVTNYLALTNLILALFNLLPGYPLDGGRLLRAWLWHYKGDYLSATRWATKAGLGLAYFLIAWGAYWVITWKTSADIFIGVWCIFIGVFLKDAADGTMGYLRSVYGLNQLRVSDVMNRPVSISPETTIEQLIGDILPRHRQTTFPVARERRFCGIVALEHLRSIPQHRWSQLTAQDVMLPIRANMVVHPHTPLTVAQSLLCENQIGSAGVIDDRGELVGFVGRLEIHKKLAS